MPSDRLPRIVLALAAAVVVGVLVVLVVSRVSATQKAPEGDFAPVVVPGTAGTTTTPSPGTATDPTARPSATAPVQATPTPRTVDDDDDDDDDEPDDPDDRDDD